MPLAAFLLVTSPIPQQIPPVPGACTEPAVANVGKPGCFLSVEVPLTAPPQPLYWHIVAMADERAARSAMVGHRWSAVVEAHGRWWLYVVSADRVERSLPAHPVAGPLHVTPGARIVARFMESWFPPGMRTRAHTHSGPEVFHVIEGEQCIETPAERRRITAGESYVVPGGPHLQAAPKGRRSLVLILAPEGEPWMRLTTDWAGTTFCR